MHCRKTTPTPNAATFPSTNHPGRKKPRRQRPCETPRGRAAARGGGEQDLRGANTAQPHRNNKEQEINSNQAGSRPGRGFGGWRDGGGPAPEGSSAAPGSSHRYRHSPSRWHDLAGRAPGPHEQGEHPWARKRGGSVPLPGSGTAAAPRPRPPALGKPRGSWAPAGEGSGSLCPAPKGFGSDRSVPGAAPAQGKVIPKAWNSGGNDLRRTIASGNASGPFPAP